MVCEMKPCVSSWPLKRNSFRWKTSAITSRDRVEAFFFFDNFPHTLHMLMSSFNCNNFVKHKMCVAALKCVYAINLCNTMCKRRLIYAYQLSNARNNDNSLYDDITFWCMSRTFWINFIAFTPNLTVSRFILFYFYSAPVAIFIGLYCFMRSWNNAIRIFPANENWKKKQTKRTYALMKTRETMPKKSHVCVQIFDRNVLNHVCVAACLIIKHETIAFALTI